MDYWGEEPKLADIEAWKMGMNEVVRQPRDGEERDWKER